MPWSGLRTDGASNRELIVEGRRVAEDESVVAALEERDVELRRNRGRRVEARRREDAASK